MSIRYKVLLVCMSFVIIAVGVSLFSHSQETKLGRLALSIYDEAFIGVNYAHKSQSEFIRFIGDHDSEDTGVLTQEDGSRLGRLIDNLDIAIERAMSDKGRTLASEIRTQIIALRDLPPGVPLQSGLMHEIDKKLNKLVDRYTADGFIYRTHSSELVATSKKWLVVVCYGAVMLAIIMALVLQRSVVPPIIRAVEVAMAIEGGKLDNKIIVKGRSETAVLLNALAQMQASIADNIRRIEEETRKAERERIANQTKSEFLTNMSHELRTPMHAILGFSRQALKRSEVAKDEKLSTMLSNIHTSGHRLLQLLNALLDLSKLEAGKINFEFRKNDIRRTIRQTIAETEILLQSKEMRINVFDGDVPRIVAYDHNAMMQVFVNLLSNAIKFSPPGSEITITLSEVSEASSEPRLLCTIEDAGVGIPVSELESIFDKFVQSSKTKSGAGGTGLGLAIAKEIVEAHHGRIWAENRVQAGACFNLLLPCEYKAEA